MRPETYDDLGDVPVPELAEALKIIGARHPSLDRDSRFRRLMRQYATTRCGKNVRQRLEMADRYLRETLRSPEA